MSSSSEFFGGGSLPILAPDLSFPSEVIPGTLFKQTTGIDASASLTLILNLVGKWDIRFLRLEGLSAESLDVELTVDGETVWDDTIPTTSSTTYLLGANAGGTSIIAESYGCDSSFLLRVKTATNTNITFTRLIRPIKS